MAADRDPLADLAAALANGHSVPFVWAIEYSRTGDPVAYAWHASASPELVACVGVLPLALEAAFVGVARALCDVFETRVFASITARALADRASGGSFAALETAVMSLYGCARRVGHASDSWDEAMAFYWLASAFNDSANARHPSSFFGRAAYHAMCSRGRDVVLPALRKHLPTPTVAALTEAVRVS